ERPLEAPDEFYVGYLPSAPPGLARVLRRTVALLLAGVGLLALGLAIAQSRADARVFEFGETHELIGRIEAGALPMLVVPRPGSDGGVSRYVLVGAGKHGAQPLVSAFDGSLVSLRASLIYSGDQTLLELVPDSLRALSGAGTSPPSDSTALGRFALRGEIVDSKCHFGVMNPGEGKPHRACAVRCISGGEPPVLRVRAADGRAHYFYLIGEDGREIGRELLDFVAEPVEITGRVERRDSLYVLRTEPAAIRRLEQGTAP
ncbi:MAG: hypothetical protein ACRDMZ_19900, partial [Solirubrobacteraceae bacterium]